MKYQDINTALASRNIDPMLLKVIQHLHAENVGLKQEIKGICRGLDVMVDTMNKVLTIASAHDHLIRGAVDGKSFSESLEELRKEHLSDIVSEEVKQ